MTNPGQESMTPRGLVSLLSPDDVELLSGNGSRLLRQAGVEAIREITT